MSTINLTEGLEKFFEFAGEIDGKMHTYKAYYPSAKQLRPLQLGYAKLQGFDKELTKAENEQTPEEFAVTKERISKEVEAASNEMMDSFKQMFEPINDSMPIDEFIDCLPTPAKKNFDKLVQDKLLAN